MSDHHAPRAQPARLASLGAWRLGGGRLAAGVILSLGSWLSPWTPALAQTSGAVPPDDSSAQEQLRPIEDDTELSYVLDEVRVRGNTKTRAWVVLRYVPFHTGTILRPDDPELALTRYRLLGTGFFRDVQLSLEKGTRRGHVVLVVEVVERNTLVVNDLWMGLAADTDAQGDERPLTAFGGIDGSELNLAGSGVTLGGALALARDQLALRVRFFNPTLFRGPWMTRGELLYNDARDFFGNDGVLKDDPQGIDDAQDRAVASYKRYGGSVGFGRDLGISSQLWLQYRLETISEARLPLAASQINDGLREPIDFQLITGRSLLSTMRFVLQHDTRDQPILASRGWVATLTGEFSLSPAGSDYAYQKGSVQASHWWSLPHAHVVSLHGFGGAVGGKAPFFERFFVGDLTDLRPGRVLGLNFDARSAPNFLGTAIEDVRYGDYAGKVWSEYRIPLYRGQRAVYGIDFFVSAGVYGIASVRDLERPAFERRGFERVPVDVTGDVGFVVDTNLGGLTFAFANIFGFIPQRSDQ